MRTLSVSSGDAKPRIPDLPVRLRSPSVPVRSTASPEEHRQPSDSQRRDSGSTTYSNSTAVTDDESIVGSADERYFKSRRNWHGHVGSGSNGFYQTVADDFKMIVRSVGEETVIRKSPKLKQRGFGDSSPKVKVVDDDELGAPQALVPAGEDLWG